MDIDEAERLRVQGLEPQWVKLKPEWIEAELARRSCLDMLMSRFGIDAALVTVPQLAKALGRSKSTIYASVKAGRFFIPHRMVGDSPMFTIDDLVTWYLSEGKPCPDSADAREGPSGAAEADPTEPRESKADMSALTGKRLRDRLVDEWVAKATDSASRRGGG